MNIKGKEAKQYIQNLSTSQKFIHSKKFSKIKFIFLNKHINFVNKKNTDNIT